MVLIKSNLFFHLDAKSLVLALYLYYFFSGPKTGPSPAPPQPKTTTSSPTKPTPDKTTVSTTTQIVPDPSQDVCQISEFDSISEIQKELHYFKNGYVAIFNKTNKCDQHENVHKSYFSILSNNKGTIGKPQKLENAKVHS